VLGKAIIGDGKGNFSLEEIEINLPGPEEVLVKMKASGVCHTDYDSLNWAGPLVLGHEGAGVVESVGVQVTHVTPGDKVLLNWATPCGECYQCKWGAQNICVNRKQAAEGRTTHKAKPINRAFRIGTMSTHTVVHRVAVTKIEVDIPFSSACIVGCGVMTGFGSAVNAAKVKPGSWVAVIGAGGVGLNIIQGARVNGANKIIAIDVNPERLKMAKDFGATEVIEASKDDKGLRRAAQIVLGKTKGRGVDYAFESTAVPELGVSPLAMCRNGGVAVQASGIEQEIKVDMRLFEWDKTYINPLYGQCRPEIDFPKIFALYKEKKLKLDELVTRTYPLGDLSNAFDDMLHGRNAKGVLLIDE